MSADPLILAIDQGGLSTRAMLFDYSGNVVTQSQVAIATQHNAEGHVEHDPDELVSSVTGVIAATLADADSSVTAGLATQRSSIVCWHRETGAALSPVISWQDRRAADLLRACAPDAGTLSRITGLVASPHYGASKLRWCLENIAAVADACAAGQLAAGPLSSFLIARLVNGQPLLADPANASRTLLWDIATHDWSPTLLRAFGVPATILPRCVPNRYAFGNLSGYEVPLTVCTGDQGAAIFSDSNLDADAVYINIGTGAFVLAPVDELPRDTSLLRSVVWQDDDYSIKVLEGTVNGAGSAVAECSTDRRVVSEADRAIGSDESLPLFLNGVSGLGSPYWREHFRSQYVGEGSPRLKLAAVLESILFLIQVNLEALPQRTGRTIRISGGLAQNPGLCQGLASLSGFNVRRSDQQEATARGLAALIAGLPAHWQRAPGKVFSAQPNPALAARYASWRTLMQAALERNGNDPVRS